MYHDIFTLPKPYPDETWYSLVARYHRHSGNIRSAETQRELFGEPVLNRINPVEMDESVIRYIKLHGQTHGTDEDCFTRYTLAPFHLRYYSDKRKEEILKRIRNAQEEGKTNVFTNYMKRRSGTYLRYCPICLQEDALRYGESYWHRAHQIWLLEKCQIHGCNLLNSTVSITRATHHLSCADEYSCPDSSINRESSMMDRLSPYIITTLDAPFTFHESTVTDSLIAAAIEAGYGEYRAKGFVCTAAKLDADIRASFGNQFVNRFTAIKDGNGATFRRVFYSHWNSRVEPAVLLAAFLQVPIKDLFKKEDREVKIREEFRKCAEYGFRWPRADLAKHLGVKEARLYQLAKELNVEPFWGMNLRQKDLIEIRTAFFVTEDERDLIDQRISELHAANRREFFWYCVRKELGL